MRRTIAGAGNLARLARKAVIEPAPGGIVGAAMI
jgi:hypothetical protein